MLQSLLRQVPTTHYVYILPIGVDLASARAVAVFLSVEYTAVSHYQSIIHSYALQH